MPTKEFNNVCKNLSLLLIIHLRLSFEFMIPYSCFLVSWLLKSITLQGDLTNMALIVSQLDYNLFKPVLLCTQFLPISNPMHNSEDNLSCTYSYLKWFSNPCLTIWWNVNLIFHCKPLPISYPPHLFVLSSGIFFDKQVAWSERSLFAATQQHSTCILLPWQSLLIFWLI